MLNLTPTRQSAIEQRLYDDLIIWLTTVSPSGKPHTVPVWFLWDGETVLIFCEPETRKIRNLRQNPAVTLALETRDSGEEVIVFEGAVELTAESTTELMNEAYIAKYGAIMPHIDSSPEIMAARYTQPIRMKPAKVIAWGIVE